MNNPVVPAPQTVTARPLAQILGELIKFHIHLRNLKCSAGVDTFATLPPAEVVPEGYINPYSGEENNPEMLESRILIFVHKLVQDDRNTWRAFVARLKEARVPERVIMRFAILTPG